MKTILFTLLLFLSHFAFSQTNIYHPFPDSNAVWNEVFNYYDYHPAPISIDNYSITISGDTTINSSIYHKLIIPYVDHTDVPPYHNNQQIAEGYIGAFRQDVNARKVFFVSLYDSLEILLYNFNLNVGDTIPDSVFCPAIVSVSSIDSILIGTNYRKRWIISGTTQMVEIIEGIGGTRGLLYTLACYIDGYSTNLNCFQQDGLPLLPNSSGPCNLINSEPEVAKSNILFQTFPNPFHTSVTIKTNIIFNQLGIYNSLGICVRQQQVKTTDIYFDRSSLPDGIYYFLLINNENIKTGGTFILN